MATTLARITMDLREQWDLLRGWLDELGDDVAAQPSSLPGWTVADLVAHLGRAMSALTACESAPGADPLTLGEYLSEYPRSAEDISATTKELSATIAHDPLGAVDQLAEQAFAHLATLAAAGEDTVVLARRGPIRLHDMAMSRLIELVVHAYDLAGELPLPAPVDPTARTLVADALLEVARHRTGADVVVGNEAAWIKVATGRMTWTDGIAKEALRPGSLSDGLPDLSASLPLL